nr:hypothetical protein [Tanacetum cinerariifolium]
MRRIKDFIPMEKEGDKEVLSLQELKVQKEMRKKNLIKEVLRNKRPMKLQDQFKNNQDDLVQLWSLVKERFSSTEPNEDKDRVLWVELKRLFEPDADVELQKLQRYMHDLLKWRLYDTCDVHHVSTERGHDIFMLVEKDYPLTKGLMTVMLVNKLQVDEFSEMANELLRMNFQKWQMSF